MRARGVSFDGNSGFNVTVCPPNAPRKEVSLQLVDRQRKTPYWIARNEFVEVSEGQVVVRENTQRMYRAAVCTS